MMANISDILEANSQNTEYSKSFVELETAVAVILSLFLVLGLSGNLLTIIALLRCPRIRNVTAAFIISLCVADCLFCILVLPWEVSRFFAGKWLWGQGAICTVLPLIRYWNVAVSLLSIAMITLNRYIMIAHFSVYNRIYKKGWIGLMITMCWMLPMAILVPTLMGKWGRFGLIEALQTCSVLDENGQSPKKVLFAVGFCVPAVVIIVCYSLIFQVIHKSDHRLREHNARSDGIGASGTPLQQKSDKETRRRRSEWRFTKMVMILFVTFVATYLPITLVKFIDPKAKHQVLHLLGYVCAYLSCCINPIIYVIMNRQYRKAYRSVLLCKQPGIYSMSSHADPQTEVQHPIRLALVKGLTCLARAAPINSAAQPEVAANSHENNNSHENSHENSRENLHKNSHDSNSHRHSAVLDLHVSNDTRICDNSNLHEDSNNLTSENTSNTLTVDTNSDITTSVDTIHDKTVKNNKYLSTELNGEKNPVFDTHE